MDGIFKIILRFGRRVFDRIERTVEEISDDPLLRSALEADLGLPPGTLNKPEAKAKRPELTGIDQYINAADPKFEQIKVTFDAIKTYVKFWTTIFDAAKTEDPSIVADELLYRLLQTTTVDLIKFDYPTAYAVMRLVGAIEQDTRLALEEAFAPEMPANIISGDYFDKELWLTQLKRNYQRFRLDQEPDLKAPGVPLNLRDKQLSLRVFALSDLGLLLNVVFAKWVLKAKLERFYGWELPPRPQPAPCGTLPPGTGIPLADHIASRAFTLRISTPQDSGPTPSATLTQLLLVDAQDRLGWLLLVGGRVAFEQLIGSPARPIKVKVTVEAPDGFSAVIRFSGDDQFDFSGAQTAGLKVEIEPVETSNRAPVIAIPETTGTRLEIGEFSFKAGLNHDGFTLRAEARKSALVIVSGEADSFVEETLPGSETRIEFDLGLTIDDKRGFRFDGGGRLATTLALNKAFGPVTVQTVELALVSGGSGGGSELRFIASAGMRFDLGPLKMSLAGIGVTMGIGTTRGPAPPAALQLLSSLLYLGDFGFTAPNLIGIVVDSDTVTGGGFLFRDPDNEQYAGALQLSLGKRWTLSAIGVLSTRLPDGRKGFSLIIIASMEFDPPYPLGLGITLHGIGLLVGIHRTMDPDALRAGLRNRTLDAVLFPQDVVANAARLVNSLRAIFPPARGHHLLGFTVSLGFGAKSVVRAELGVVYEFGARRWAVMGQLHVEFPATIKGQEVTKKKILEMHVDAVGIWDLNRGEFSLDATLYHSRIAFVSFSGDVAVRMRKGDASFFLFSAGGYHPEFAVPPGFPQLQRLRISLADTKHLRVLLTGYIAITSNTRQIGARMEIFVGFSGFSIESTLSFDALWEPDVRFVVVFDAEFKIKYKGITFFGVDVYGRFTGPAPKRVVGKWSIDLWLTSISKSFDRTFGDDRPPLALPAVDPLPALVTALKEAGNWSSDLPGSAHTMVTLRKRLDSTQVLVHPLGQLGVRQQVLPLSIRIDRFAGSPVAGGPRFDITAATVGGRPVGALRTVDEQFAAAEFIELSDDEKITRPSFEAMPAGVTMSADGIAFGSQTAISEMDYDDRIVGVAVPGPVPTRSVGGELAVFAAAFGPAARSALRTTGTDRFAATGPDLRVGQERFVVARVDDLTRTEITGVASFTAARQALDRHLAANPDARGLQVVAAFTAEPAT